ncbi:MAG: ABC transporter permease [Lachnospiraceae bacterium]|nr:ABC transporter permease [Lachnospiraceae bacterium]
MLFKKMLREMGHNVGQFFSIFLLSFLAVFIYSGFESNVVGSGRAVEEFHDKTNVADLWVYSEGFTQENLEAVRNLDIVSDAQLRTEVTGTAPDFGGAQTDIYLEYESFVIMPLAAEGDEFIPSDGYNESGDNLGKEDTSNYLWLNKSFADQWGIKVGDDFTVEYNGITFTRKIKGLVMTPEYEFTKAEKDADVNLKNLAYVYMSYDAFPFRDYINRLIETEKITAKSLAEDSDILDEKKEELEAYGIDIESLDKDTLLQIVENMSDEDIRKLVPYSTMLIALTDDAGNADVKDKSGNVSVAMSYEKEIADAIDNNYAVMIDAKSVPGIERVRAELEQHDMFSYTFALIFLIVAVLVISTTMSRLVERQRTQVGTLNALGLKRYKISLHYMGYSFFVSFLGAIIGLILGPVLVGSLMIEMIMEWYVVPDVATAVNYKFYIVAVAVVLCCVLASFLSCNRLLKVPPAAALRPAAPKKPKRTIFERLPFWNKLGFSTQYNLRDISRAPMRAIMGIIGTAVGMVLVVYSFGCKILVDDIVDWNFDKIQNFDYEMVLSEDENASYFDNIADEVDGELVMLDSIEISKVKNATAADKSKQVITVLEGKGLYNITDEKTNVTSVVPGTISITSRLAKTMGIKVGDTVYWHIYSKNTWYESKVGSISRSPETAGIVILREDLEALGCEFTPSILVTDKDVKSYESRDGISTVYEMSELKRIFVEGYEVINMLFYMMMAFSLITTVVVLYNSGNISFHERLKEFATLKVMGLSSSKIRGILNQENIWLSILGVIVGAPFAKPSLIAMMNSNGDNFDYYIDVPVYLYILSGAFVLFVAFLVSFMFSKKIKKIDMVEILKGME